MEIDTSDRWPLNDASKDRKGALERDALMRRQHRRVRLKGLEEVSMMHGTLLVYIVKSVDFVGQRDIRSYTEGRSIFRMPYAYNAKIMTS